MDSRKIFYILVNVYFYLASATEIESDDILHRDRRQLLWPNSSLLQFNVGIGTPSPAKQVNVNYAFQANFQLPWNRTQIPTDILHTYTGYDGVSRKKRDTNYFGKEEMNGDEKRDYDDSKDRRDYVETLDGDYVNDAKLFHIYKYIEDVLNGYGHDGHSCVKQALCEIGAQPLHSEDEEDLLHELAAFVLNPVNDVDQPMKEKHEAVPYIQAYKHGQDSRRCTYENCKFSLVDVFTKIHIGD